MGMEIERKYLLRNNDWRSLGDPVSYVQGYLVANSGLTVRIRVAEAKGFVTIKGNSYGLARKEFEYQIPLDEATELLKMCTLPIIEKYRTKILYDDKIWEVDEFEGENQGLIIAEIELKSEDETFLIPSWIGQEVTGDIRYYNSHLAKNPFKNW